MKIGIAGGIAGLALFCVTPLRAATNPALPPLASGTFTGYGAAAGVTTNQYDFDSYQTTLAPGSFSLSYDAASQTYRVGETPGLPALIYGPGTFAAQTPAEDVYQTVLPRTAHGVGGTSLTLLRNVAANPKIDLTYMSYAIGSLTTYGNGIFDPDFYRSYAGLIGQGTAAGAVPRTGAAYYSGIVDGYALKFRLSGTGNILANFYTGEIATGLSLFREGGIPVGNFAGRGLIAGGSSQFGGDLFGTDNSWLGRFSGGFFGPAAQEAGYAFSASLPGGSATLSGVLVAKQAALPPAVATPVVSTPPGPNATLTGPLVSQTFATRASRMTVNTNKYLQYASGINAAGSQLLDSGTLTIRYDAANGEYIITDGSVRGVLFSPRPDTLGITTSWTLPTYTVRDDPRRSASLLKNGNDNPYIKLTYLSYGIWADEANLRVVSGNYRSFIYGVETAAADMPRTGAALYNGAVDGYWADKGRVYRLQGSDGSLLANFASGEVRTTMRLAPAPSDNPGPPAPIRVEGYGSIAGGTSYFSGVHQTADNAYSGTFQGGFYGPAHQEAGASFVLRGQASDSSITGVLVATQAPLN